MDNQFKAFKLIIISKSLAIDQTAYRTKSMNAIKIPRIENYLIH